MSEDDHPADPLADVAQTRQQQAIRGVVELEPSVPPEGQQPVVQRLIEKRVPDLLINPDDTGCQICGSAAFGRNETARTSSGDAADSGLASSRNSGFTESTCGRVAAA
jgi:hypothetical protein